MGIKKAGLEGRSIIGMREHPPLQVKPNLHPRLSGQADSDSDPPVQFEENVDRGVPYFIDEIPGTPDQCSLNVGVSENNSEEGSSSCLITPENTSSNTIPEVSLISSSSIPRDDREEEQLFKKFERCTQKLSYLFEIVSLAFSEFDGTNNSLMRWWKCMSEYLGTAFHLEVDRNSPPDNEGFSRTKMGETKETDKGRSRRGEMGEDVTKQEDAIILDEEENWFTIVNVIVQTIFMFPKDDVVNGRDERFEPSPMESITPTEFWAYFCTEEDVGPYSLEVWRRVYANGLCLLLPELGIFNFQKEQNSSARWKRRKNFSSHDANSNDNNKISEMIRKASLRAMLEWVLVQPIELAKEHPTVDEHSTSSSGIDKKAEMEKKKWSNVEVAPEWTPFLRLYPFLRSALHDLRFSLSEQNLPPSPFSLSTVLMIDTVYWVSSWYPIWKMLGSQPSRGVRLLWWYESPQLLWDLSPGDSLQDSRSSCPFSTNNQENGFSSSHYSARSQGYGIDGWNGNVFDKRSLAPFLSPQEMGNFSLPSSSSLSQSNVLLSNTSTSYLTSLSPVTFFGPPPSPPFAGRSDNFLEEVPREESPSVSMQHPLGQGSGIRLADIKDFLHNLFSLLRLEARNIVSSEECSDSYPGTHESPFHKKEYNKDDNGEEMNNEELLRLMRGVAVPIKWMKSLVSWIETCRNHTWIRRSYNFCEEEEKLVEDEAAEEGLKMFFPPSPGPIPTLELPSLERECSESWRSPVRHRFYKSIYGKRTTNHASSSAPLVEVLPQPVFDFLVAHFGLIGPRYFISGTFFSRSILLHLLKPPFFHVEFNFERCLAKKGQSAGGNSSTEKGTLKVGSQELEVRSDRQFVNATVGAFPRTTIADAMRSALYEVINEGEMTSAEEAGWLAASIRKRPSFDRKGHDGINEKFWEKEYGTSSTVGGLSDEMNSSVSNSSHSCISSWKKDGEQYSKVKNRSIFVSFLNLDLFPPAPTLPTSSGSASTSSSPSFSNMPLADVQNQDTSSSSSPILEEIDMSCERVEDVLNRLRKFCVETQRAWPLSGTSPWETITLTINAHYSSPFSPPEMNVSQKEWGTLVSALFSEGKSMALQTSIPGICGIRNLGNTCFMNSAIQCLGHLETFRTALLSQSLSTYFSEKNSVSKALQKVFIDMWSEFRPHVLQIDDFKKDLASRRSRYMDFLQQDASEFITEVLDCMSEELNMCMTPKYREKSDADRELPPQVLSELFWDDFLENQNSFIPKLFFVQSLCRFTCLKCYTTSVVPENNCNIPLPLIGVCSAEAEITVILEILFPEDKHGDYSQVDYANEQGEEDSSGKGWTGVEKRRERKRTEGCEYGIKKGEKQTWKECRQERFIRLEIPITFEYVDDGETDKKVFSSAPSSSTILSYFDNSFMSVPLIPSVKLKFTEDAQELLCKQIKEDGRVLKKISELYAKFVAQEGEKRSSSGVSSSSMFSPSRDSIQMSSSYAPGQTPCGSSPRTTRSHVASDGVNVPIPSRVEIVQFWEKPESAENRYGVYARCWCDKSSTTTSPTTTTPAKVRDAKEKPMERVNMAFPRRGESSKGRSPPPSISVPIWYCLSPLPRKAESIQMEPGNTENCEVVFIEDLSEEYLYSCDWGSAFLPPTPSFLSEVNREMKKTTNPEREGGAGEKGEKRAEGKKGDIEGDIDKKGRTKGREEMMTGDRRSKSGGKEGALDKERDQNTTSTSSNRHTGGGRGGLTPAVLRRARELASYHLKKKPSGVSSEGQGRKVVKMGWGREQRGESISHDDFIIEKVWSGAAEGTLPRYGRTESDRSADVATQEPCLPSMEGAAALNLRSSSEISEETESKPAVTLSESHNKKNKDNDHNDKEEIFLSTSDSKESWVIGSESKESLGNVGTSAVKEEDLCVCLLNLISNITIPVPTSTNYLCLAGGCEGNSQPHTFSTGTSSDAGSTSSPNTVPTNTRSPNTTGSSEQGNLEYWKKELFCELVGSEDMIKSDVIKDTEKNFLSPSIVLPENPIKLGVSTRDNMTSGGFLKGVYDLQSGDGGRDGSGGLDNHEYSYCPDSSSQEERDVDYPFFWDYIRLDLLEKYFGGNWADEYFKAMDSHIEKWEVAQGLGDDVPVISQTFSSPSTPVPSPSDTSEGVVGKQIPRSVLSRKLQKGEGGEGERGTTPPLVITIFYDPGKYEMIKEKSLSLIQFEKNRLFHTSETDKKLTGILNCVGEEKLEEQEERRRQRRREALLCESMGGYTPFNLSLHKALLMPQLLSGDDAWYCPQCQAFQLSTVQRSLFRLPPCLLLTFSRFKQVGNSMQKKNNLMNFPEQIDMSSFLDPAADQSQLATYELKGVLYHCGSLDYGHYTSSAYVSSIRKWVFFNDRLTSVLDSFPAREDAYVLFYERLTA